MLKNVLRLSVLLILLVVFGCKTGEVVAVSPKNFSNESTPAGTAQVAKLVPGDSIELSVEVDGRMEVAMHLAEINHLGFVTLPLVGDLHIGGLTLGGSRDVIAKAYGAYFVNPPVVMISRMEDSVQGEWGFVTVTGRVNTPGRVKVESAKGIKLTSAIQQAGGFSGSAKKNAIRVTRTDADGRRIQVEVDYDQIGQKGNLDADIDLKDGDVIYVPQRIW